MTAALLEREAHDAFEWKAHAHLDLYRAVDEAEILHLLHPGRMLLLDRYAKRNGGVLPAGFAVPHIEKADFDLWGAEIQSTRDEPGNILVNAGINRLGSLLIGGGGQAYDHTHCALGVGDTATAATAADTDLAAAVNAANRYFQMADTSYPTFSAQVLTVISTFLSANANFAWAEWGIDQHTASGATAAVAPLLNRKVASLGTKTSAGAWALTATVTLS